VEVDCAIKRLMAEVQKGFDSVKTEEDWISEEAAKKRLCIDDDCRGTQFAPTNNRVCCGATDPKII